MHFLFRLGIVLLALLPASAQTGPVVLKSPDGAIELTIATLKGQSPSDAGGRLAYRVSFHGKALFHWSGLGLALQDSPELGPDVRIASSQASASDDTWTSPHGKSNPIRNHYNAVSVEVNEVQALSRRFSIEARAYDDGVAFRYFIPEQPSIQSFRLTAELTEFRPAKDAETYPLILKSYQTSYEDSYHQLPLSALHPDYLVALPLLMEVPGVGWVALTEADIENWAGMYVGSPKRGAIGLEARLSPRIDEPGVAVTAAAPARSPWRVLMIATEPARLIESNLVVNLNPPSAIADTSWIKPGKTAWDWWSGSQARNVDFKPGMNTATMKHYIDFAGRNGIEYMLIDAGWAKAGGGPNDSGSDLTQTNPNINMPELLEHARSKNVRLWLWANWYDVNRQMDEAFALFEKWGVAGVKVDFMDRDDQWMVNWYRHTARKAAEHKLMLDFHGAFKPDGLRRTYPNVLTREGGMGLEYLKWSASITPKYNATLPFTRLLAGPHDYTPGGFDNVTREAFQSRNDFPMVMGTRAHQTALYVVFESPFQMLADFPGAYDGQKELEFLKAVPTTWDETRGLNGVPSKYVTIARRRGTEWYIGSITDWDARELEVPLSFLGSGSYTAQIYADAPDASTEPKHSTREEKRVDAKTVLKLKLASGGGCAIRIVPANR